MFFQHRTEHFPEAAPVIVQLTRRQQRLQLICAALRDSGHLRRAGTRNQTQQQAFYQ